MIKRVSLVRRRAGLAPEEFIAHWLGAHADIVRELPGIRGLRFGLVQAWTPADVHWDGVGEVWFDSIEAELAAFAFEPHASMLAANRSLLFDEVQWCFVEEHTAIPPP